MGYSEYQNLEDFLNYRTSNIGLTILTDEMLKSPKRDVFSFIQKADAENNKEAGIELLDDTYINKIGDASYEITNGLDREDIIMKSLVFNTDVVKESSVSYKKIIAENNTTFDYDAFTHIENTALFYDNNFNRKDKYQISKDDIDITTNLNTKKKDYHKTFSDSNKIVDFDISKYASQDVIKALFVIDVITQIYEIISVIKDDRESINSAIQFLSLRTRYYIDSNDNWKVCDFEKTSDKKETYYLIDLNNLLYKETSNPDPNDSSKTINERKYDETPDPTVISVNTKSLNVADGVITKEKAQTMINLCKDVILKHVNYIKYADTIYYNNYRDFYKVCRMLLNYTILSAIDQVVKTNKASVVHTLYQSTNSDYYDTDDSKCSHAITYDGNKFSSIFGNNASFNDLKYSERIYNISHSTDANECDGTGLVNNHMYKDDVTDDIYIPIASEAVSSISTEETTNEKYRLIYTTTYTDTNSKKSLIYPVGCVCEYIHVNSDVNPTLILDTNHKITKITNLKKNKIYLMKIRNGWTSATLTNGFVNATLSNGIIGWNESIKTLIIKASNDLTLNTQDVPGSTIDASSLNLRLISIEGSSGDLTIPPGLTDDVHPINIYLPDATVLPDIQNGSWDNSTKMATFSAPFSNKDSMSLGSNFASLDNKFIYNYPSSDDAGLQDSSVILRPKTYCMTFMKYESVVDILSKSGKESGVITLKNDGSSVLLEPLSYEKDTNHHKDFAEKYFRNIILHNFAEKISDTKSFDTADNDKIIKSMTNLSEINKNISNSSTIIKKNYSEFKSENSKVLSSNNVELVSTFILVAVIFVAFYLPMSKMDKNNAISAAGILLIIVIITYVIVSFIIYTRYKELIETYENYSDIKSDISSIFDNLKRNLYNQKTRISQKVVLPALLKEEDYFKRKDDKFNVYKGRTYGDLQIERRARQKNVARITFLLEISIIISLSLLLYIIRPSWINTILTIALLLLIISLFLLFVRLTNVVHTNSRNIYWTKPTPSLEKLKFAGTTMV